MKRDLVIWLYGSVARGDSDDLSDIDVLCIGDIDPDLIAWLRSEPSAHVSEYTWGEIESMHSYGSLFLLHLKLEGRELFAGEGGRDLFRDLLETLPEYQRSRCDLEAFRQALADVDESIREGGDLAFEAGVACTVVRHAAILGCYLIGKPCFDRRHSLLDCCRATGAEIAPRRVIHTFESLKRRDGKGSPAVDSTLVRDLLTAGQTLIDRIKECLG